MRIGPTGPRERPPAGPDDQAEGDHLLRVLLAAGMGPLVLGLYVLLLLLGLPTAEYLALIVGPTLSVVVGFVLAGRISNVRQLLTRQHRETVTVLSDQNLQVTALAEVVAAVVVPAAPPATAAGSQETRHSATTPDPPG